MVAGPTGEGPALTEPERDRILRVVLAAAGGRIPVIAATESNGTRTAIARTRTAEAAGAAATLAVTPFYDRPTQEGLSRHFAAIAAAADRRSSSTGSRPAPGPTCCPRPWPASPSCRGSPGSSMPPATSPP